MDSVEGESKSGSILRQINDHFVVYYEEKKRRIPFWQTEDVELMKNLESV